MAASPTTFAMIAIHCFLFTFVGTHFLIIIIIIK
jgi:hypothetical protein